MSDATGIIAYQIRARIADLNQRIRGVAVQEESANDLTSAMIANTERQCLQQEIAFLLDILAQLEIET